jgi:hypothetical protein
MNKQARLKELLLELAALGTDMHQKAPELDTQLRGLVGLDEEKLDREVENLIRGVPEPVRDKAMDLFISSLEVAKRHYEVTKWRIDRRVQPEDQTRDRSENSDRKFSSFCRPKRKPEW